MAEDRSIRVTVGDEQPITITLDGCTGISGDMQKSVYDTNDNGIVDAAQGIDDGAGNVKSAAQIYNHIENHPKELVYDTDYKCYTVAED